MASACIAYDQYAGLQVDNGGNILSKKEYAYTTGTLGTVQDTISYDYGDSAWKDLLTSYDGQTLTSDAIGNLTNDGTWTYSWQHGRQLAQMSKANGSGTENVNYTKRKMRVRIMQSVSKESSDSTAYQELQKKNRSWNKKWLMACIVMLCVATIIYWGAVNSWMLLDRGHTATNTMIAMSMSGMVMLIYRIPRIRDMSSNKLENLCMLSIGLCFFTNACLSLVPESNCLNYIMTMIIGVSTGSVSLMFCSFNSCLDKKDKKLRSEARKHRKRKISR